MRTVAEIKLAVRERLAAREAEQEALDARVNQLQQSLDNAKAAQKAAAAAGNSAEYERAYVDQAYLEACIENARRTQVAPAFTKDELIALAKEINDARKAEIAPIYQRMVEVRAEGHDLYAQADSISKDMWYIWSKLLSLPGGSNVPIGDIHPSIVKLFKKAEGDHILIDAAARMNKQ